MKKYKPANIFISMGIVTDYPRAYKLWSIESNANVLSDNRIQDIISFFDKHKVHIELTFFKEGKKNWYSFDIILGDSGLCLNADPRFYQAGYLRQYSDRDTLYYTDIIRWAFKTLEGLK